MMKFFVKIGSVKEVVPVYYTAGMVFCRLDGVGVRFDVDLVSANRRRFDKEGKSRQNLHRYLSESYPVPTPAEVVRFLGEK